jgi:parallel beta-helix repeat protein
VEVDGFAVRDSSVNILSGNTASSDMSGFELWHASSNTLTENTAKNNGNGFELDARAGSNTFTKNTAKNNFLNGFAVMLPALSNNRFTGNTADSNRHFGYYDPSRGSGTAGTANSYAGNTCSDNGYTCSGPFGLGAPQW